MKKYFLLAGGVIMCDEHQPLPADAMGQMIKVSGYMYRYSESGSGLVGKWLADGEFNIPFNTPWTLQKD